MNSDRRVGLVIIPLVLLGLSAGILCRWMIAPPDDIENLWLAIPGGGTMGLLICWWLHRVWDPKNLSSKGQYSNSTSGCWLTFAVIGGIVFANITASILTYNSSQLLAASLGVFIYVMLIYLWVQAFRYRNE